MSASLASEANPRASSNAIAGPRWPSSAHNVWGRRCLENSGRFTVVVADFSCSRHRAARVGGANASRGSDKPSTPTVGVLYITRRPVRCDGTCRIQIHDSPGRRRGVSPRCRTSAAIAAGRGSQLTWSGAPGHALPRRQSVRLAAPSPVLRLLLLEPLPSASHVLPMSTFIRFRSPAWRRAARGIGLVGDARAWLSPRRSWSRCAAMAMR